LPILIPPVSFPVEELFEVFEVLLLVLGMLEMVVAIFLFLKGVH
jgi:hypothetical protein